MPMLVRELNKTDAVGARVEQAVAAAAGVPATGKIESAIVAGQADTDVKLPVLANPMLLLPVLAKPRLKSPARQAESKL